MDYIAQWVFYREIEHQCKFALMAYEDLKQALNEHNEPRPASPEPNSKDIAQIQATMARREQWLRAKESYDQKRKAAEDRFWYSFQAFLVAAGNLSKLLWPAYQKGENLIPERGPDLRASLEVGEDSPLRSRTLRNHFEHFDVRLEQWAVSSKPRHLADLNIASASMLSSADPRDNLRNFDPHTFIVPFRGESYHVLPLVEAIEQLQRKVTVLLQRRASG